MFDEHRIVVRTQENMTINLEKIQCLAADAEELAVFVEHSCMAKTVMKKNAHDGRGKSGGRGFGHRFHAGKTAHPTASDEVRIGALKTNVFARNICVKMHYQKWSLDRKVVDKLGGFDTGKIQECTARAGRAHPLNVGVHCWPVEVEA